MSKPNKLKGGQAAVQALSKEKTKHVFGLIGSATMEIFDALYDEKDIKERMKLNFGHTIGHAIESKYKIEFFFSISAKKNTGIKKLLEEITKYSYKSEWIFKKDEITNKDDKFIINELLRETILEYLHKEIPYNINLEVIVFKTLKNKDIKPLFNLSV